jgi:alpha-N-arabinofuranosidase
MTALAPFRPLFLALLASALPGQGGPIPNGSFELREGDRPAQWSRSTWAGRAELTLVDGAGRGGSRAVRIASATGADVGWTCTAAVLPFSRYRLVGWIRSEGIEPGSGRGAMLNLHGRGPEYATSAVVGDSDWRRVELELDTGADDTLTINCLFGGWGRSTGVALFDDLALELLERGEVPQPELRIDAGRERTPISPYVYGQFIEHLGRCIQGGIWAEMLPDRKFFHPVGSEASPWRVVGAATVAMDPEQAFAAVPAPVLSLDGRGGLRHEGLPLTAGRSYECSLWVRGDPSCGGITVELTGCETGPPAPAPSGQWTQHRFRFAAGTTTDEGRLSIRLDGRGECAIGAVSLMPADAVQGLRRDTLTLLRELDAPVYRWPGGNFVSGYDWRDGIGDRDRRPPRKNPAWQGIESNDFGLHEFIAFCRLLGTEPYIAVNAGSGEAAAAAEQVRYCNAPTGDPLGAERASNGDAASFGVRIWGIGNEMYGDWQIGHMPVARYTAKHNAFATAMRAADPSITLVAVGAVGAWDEAMLAGCEGFFEHVSEHIYVQERPGLYAHVRLLPDAIRGVAEAWRGYRARFPWLEERGVRLAMDEWNHWYGPHVFGELGTRYFLKDGLGVAAGLHEFFRHSDLFWMANYAQTVNVIGCIKTSPRAAAFETTGLVLKLYRRHFGTVPVEVAQQGMIDAAAAWTADRRALTLAVVNPSREPATVPVDWTGARLLGTGRRYEIGGADPQAFNDPDRPAAVVITEHPVEGLGETLAVGPCSLTLLVLDARPAETGRR